MIAAGAYKIAEESKKVITGIENTTHKTRTGRANLVTPEKPDINFQEDVTMYGEIISIELKPKIV